MKNISFRIDEELAHEIVNEAEKRGVSKSKVYRERLQRSQDDQEKIEQLQEEKQDLKERLDQAQDRIDQLHDKQADHLDEMRNLAGRLVDLQEEQADRMRKIEANTESTDQPWYKKLFPGN